MQPIETSLEANKKYYWCSCGKSEKQPFCDGAHKEDASGKKSQQFEVSEPQTAWLCTCKKTANPPYCDGTHNL